MRNNIFYFVTLALILWSCGEEEDRVIRTDLPTEAQQIFDVSKLQSEHLFLTLTTWEQFLSLDPTTLPGCPEIILEEGIKRVTIDYGNKKECDSKNERSGKVILDLALQANPNGEWFVEYEKYSYQGDTLFGGKVLKRSGLNTINESYEGLKIKSSTSTSFTLAGEFIHTTPSNIGSLLNLVSTTGEIIGLNPSGRNVTMTTTQVILTSAACARSTDNLPISGTEIWKIGRGNGDFVEHSLSYETAGICETTAKMELPDGRVLILNP